MCPTVAESVRPPNQKDDEVEQSRKVTIQASGCCIALYVFSFWVKPIETIHSLLVPVQKSAQGIARQMSITHIVKTIPPLNINRASRGTAPDQNVKTPSSLKILAAQEKLFLYSLLASIDCILYKIRR